MKRLFCGLLLLIVLFSFLFAAGVEPSGNPRQVSTLNHLLWISTNNSSWGDNFEQTADIDASSTSTWNPDGGGGYYGFIPIGNNSTKFTGTYNGQGYAINGLTVNRSAESYIGLFGYINGGTIQNLGITNANMTGYRYVGTISGDIHGASAVTYCYSTGTVNGSINTGGLIGYNDNSTISYCYSTCTVSGGQYVGGLVSATGGLATVSCCFSKGSVSGTSDVGGFIGNHYYSFIRNCYSRGDVTRLSGTSTSIGGFCGYNYQDIEYCYSTGSVFYAGTSPPTDKGFVGTEFRGNYISNFFDNGSNQSTAIGATAKTSTEMKIHTTFTGAGWDFVMETANGTNNYWEIDYTGTINNGYPFLFYENGDQILPVELSSFTVENSLSGVLCQWTTESETENLGFILERSTEGPDWIEIANYKTDEGLLGQGSTPTVTDYEYLDVNVEPNITYEYRLADVDYNNIITYHSAREVTVKQTLLSSKIEKFTVLPAYPNPFNPSTTLRYGLETDSHVIINIYDITGQLITTLVNKNELQGWHSVVWDGTNRSEEQVPAGLYLSRVISDNAVRTNKLMLMK